MTHESEQGEQDSTTSTCKTKILWSRCRDSQFWDHQIEILTLIFFAAKIVSSKLLSVLRPGGQN